MNHKKNTIKFAYHQIDPGKGQKFLIFSRLASPARFWYPPNFGAFDGIGCVEEFLKTADTILCTIKFSCLGLHEFA